jgi:hypothetical protein
MSDFLQRDCKPEICVKKKLDKRNLRRQDIASH